MAGLATLTEGISHREASCGRLLVRARVCVPGKQGYRKRTDIQSHCSNFAIHSEGVRSLAGLGQKRKELPAACAHVARFAPLEIIIITLSG